MLRDNLIRENNISNFELFLDRSEGDNKKSTETYVTKIFLLLM